MYYFSYISYNYTCKNALHKEVAKFLESKERIVIPAAEIGMFKSEILAGISVFNCAHKKCKPLEPVWNTHDDGDFELWLGSGIICSFHLYKSKNE